jgi:hypothetical protein
MSPTVLANESIDMELIYSLWKALFGNLGEDERFFWNCEVYTIAKEVEANDFLGEISKEELEAIQDELEEI